MTGPALNPINVIFANSYLQARIKHLGDKEKESNMLIDAYKDSHPESSWLELDEESILELARTRKTKANYCIKKAQTAIQDIGNVTNASIINELDEAREMAKDQENASTMITATMSKAKISGLIVNKVQSEIGGTINVQHEMKTIPKEFLQNLQNNGAILPDNIVDITPNE